MRAVPQKPDELWPRWKDLFPSQSRDGHERIALGSSKAELSLTRFVEYGFLVFKAVSQQEGFKWDVLPAGFRLSQAHRIPSPTLPT